MEMIEHYFLMRRRKKITLKELAKECSCSIGLISLYENHNANMSPEKVQKYKEYITNK